jgi:ketosteroid isomerase-like protein
MPSNKDALELTKNYIRAIETQDRETIADSLAENVRQVFPMAAGGFEGIQAVFEGKEEVLEYTYGLFEKFSSLKWVDADWTISNDGARVFLQAKGDLIVAHSNAPYRNTYVIRFDIEEGKIVHITEYANADLYVAQGIAPREVELRAVERARQMSR